MKLGIIAGEASGDLLGAGLIRALRERCPDLTCHGVAGPLMLDAGCTTAFPMERLSVMGLVEVVGRYIELLPARRRLVEHWLASPPDVFVGIDAPDFNLDLELRLKAAGIPVVHYVSPSVWAWRRYRIRKIARAVNKMLCLFPFEVALYREHGIDAEFVGHPLGERIPAMDPAARLEAARQELGLPRRGRVVALLPGSRTTEVSRLSAPLLGAANWLYERAPDLTFLLPLANQTCESTYREAIGTLRPPPSLRVLEQQSLTAMAAADVVITASGTATLEAMLLGKPMVITYRTAPATWAIGRRLLHVPHVGLPNLLAGEGLVPELLQDAGTPEALGAAAWALLTQPDLRTRITEVFERLGEQLRYRADERAAEAVLRLVQQRVSK